MSQHRRAESAHTSSSWSARWTASGTAGSSAPQHADEHPWKQSSLGRPHNDSQYTDAWQSIWLSDYHVSQQQDRDTSRPASKGRSDADDADGLPGPHLQELAASNHYGDIWGSVSLDHDKRATSARRRPNSSTVQPLSRSSRSLRQLRSGAAQQAPRMSSHRRTASAANPGHKTVHSHSQPASGTIASRYSAYLDGASGSAALAPAETRTAASSNTEAQGVNAVKRASGGYDLVWTSPHAAVGSQWNPPKHKKKGPKSRPSSTIRAHSPIQVSATKSDSSTHRKRGPATISKPNAPAARAAGRGTGPGSSSRKAPNSKGRKHSRHKSSPQVAAGVEGVASSPLAPLTSVSSTTGTSPPRESNIVPVASNHWRILSSGTAVSQASPSVPSFAVPSVQVSPMSAAGGRRRVDQPTAVHTQHFLHARQTPAPAGIRSPGAVGGGIQRRGAAQSAHRRVRSAETAVFSSAPADPIPVGRQSAAASTHGGLSSAVVSAADLHSMDAALHRLKIALQQSSPHGPGSRSHNIAVGTATSTSKHPTSARQGPPTPNSADPPRAAVQSQPMATVQVESSDTLLRSVRSSAGPLRPVLSEVLSPSSGQPQSNPRKPQSNLGKKQAPPYKTDAPHTQPADDSPTEQQSTAHTARAPAMSDHGKTSPPPAPPSKPAAQEAAATIRQAALSRKLDPPQDMPASAPPAIPTSKPASGKKSAQFLAAQAGLQAVIAKQQAASIVSPADAAQGSRRSQGGEGVGDTAAAAAEQAARTANPLAPDSTTPTTHATAATTQARPSHVSVDAARVRVLPPVPRRRTKAGGKRPQSAPFKSSNQAKAEPPKRTEAETQLPAKHASRRAAALNELVTSEVVYISKLQRLVQVFEAPTAPAGGAPLADAPPPAALLGEGPFFLAPAEAEHETPRGSLTPSSSHSGTPMASPEHVRSKSSSGRRFSWLGGARDPSTFLSAEQHTTLFRAVHTLLPLHFDLLQQLHDSIRSCSDSDSQARGPGQPLVTADSAGKVEMGEVMLQFSPFFKMYNQYVAGHGAALTLLAELSASDSAFTDWLRRTEMSPAAGGQTLPSFLIMPVQRVPRYALLLKELLAHTPPSHCDHEPLKQALGVVEGSASRINAAISEFAMRQQVVQLQAALTPAPTPSLVGPSTRFVLAGWLHKVTGGSSTREYLVVLLSDCLVYASVGVGKNSTSLQAHKAAYREAMTAAVDGSHELQRAVKQLELPLDRGQLKLHNRLQVAAVEASLDGKGRHCLQLEATPKSVQFVCQGQLEAAMWKDTLQSVLQEQAALQERRRRGSVVAAAASGGEQADS